MDFAIGQKGEMMNDMISLEAALDAVREAYENEETLDGYEYRLNELPCEEPRMKGKWIPSDTDGFVCSVCRNGYRSQPTLMGKPMFEFCPVCGAEMQKGEDDE